MSNGLLNTEIAGAFTGGSISCAPLPASASRGEKQYQSQPAWGARSFESAESTRLNQAHWQLADDQSVNAWLVGQLATIRSRANYESRQNGTVLGVINTHADDISGPDGPTLQVISDDEDYNNALEAEWKNWFAAPTHRHNVSGAAWLKLRIRSLWKNGEYIDQIITDPTAEGPVKLRLRPIHPRRLKSPIEFTGDPNVFMGIRFNDLGQPTQYYISDPSSISGQQLDFGKFTTIPPDLLIHEFLAEEEDQARGIPWLNTALQPSADLRDYDDQIQDAARQVADQSALLYTDHIDAHVWETPESTTIERRTIKMVPPGWKPFIYNATMPPVQYSDYRSERQRDIGRPQGIPLIMIRLDSSKSNYSSARLDTQTYGRAVAGIQYWLSGTENSYGTLNRLVDLVAKEAKFSIPTLRKKPANVRYQWTWPTRPHVDPSKEALADATNLESGTTCLSDVLSSRGTNLETHIKKKAREIQAFKDADLPLPAWMQGTQTDARSNLQDAVNAEEAGNNPAPEPESEPMSIPKKVPANA